MRITAPCLLLTLCLAEAIAGDSSLSTAPEPHWSHLPIWGTEAQARGYSLPLPFGAGVNLYHEEQPFNVTGLTVAVGGGVPVEVSNFVEVSQIQTRQNNANLRLDAWLFPFLNVYGIAGYTSGTSKGSVFIPEIGVGETVIVPATTLPLDISYHGPTVGGGVTLAGGTEISDWHKLLLFVVADFNYTLTPLDFKNEGLESDTDIVALVSSFRLGLRGKMSESLHLSVWGGAMVQSVDQALAGRVPANNLAFTLNEEAEAPVNAIVGGRLEIGSHWDVLVEGGIGTRSSIMGSIGFRF